MLVFFPDGVLLSSEFSPKFTERPLSQAALATGKYTTLCVEMSTTEVTEHVCPYFITERTTKNSCMIIYIMFHAKLSYINMHVKQIHTIDANVKLQAGTNLNTVAGRKQLILALLYPDWLMA